MKHTRPRSRGQRGPRANRGPHTRSPGSTPPPERRPHLGRRGRTLAAVALGVAVAAVGVVSLTSDHDERSDDGDVLDVVHTERVPDAYRIVYRVDDHAGGEHLVRTDELIVRRPFESRLETRAGAPPGDAPQGVTVTSFGRYATTSPNAAPLVGAVLPTLAGGDVRFDATLPDLVRSGVVEMRGRRVLLGRPCRVLRTGEPIATGVTRVPTAESYADECVDDRGLVLAETWVEGGRVLREKTAVDIDDRPAPDDALFIVAGELLPAAYSGVEVVGVPPGWRPEGVTLWELPRAPAGFTHRGRYQVRLRRDTGSTQVPQELAPTSEVVFDVWVDGPRVLLVEQGDVTAGSPPRPRGPHARPVELGNELDGARLVVGAFGNSVEARPDATRYVRAFATLPGRDVVALARTLRPVRAQAPAPHAPAP